MKFIFQEVPANLPTKTEFSKFKTLKVTME